MQNVLQVGDHFRDGGLGHRKLLGGLGHAAPMHDGEKNMKIAQLEVPADTTLPVLERLIHRYSLYPYREIRRSLYILRQLPLQESKGKAP